MKAENCGYCKACARDDFANCETFPRGNATEQARPVAWRRWEDGMWIYYETHAWPDVEPLYAAPLPAPLPVTDERERFEAALGAGRDLSLTPDGVYANHFTRHDFDVWQARAVLALSTPQSPPTGKAEQVLRDGLRQIKAMVCGDLRPNWVDREATYCTRGRIADICERADMTPEQLAAIDQARAIRDKPATSVTNCH